MPSKKNKESQKEYYGAYDSVPDPKNWTFDSLKFRRKYSKSLPAKLRKLGFSGSDLPKKGSIHHLCRTVILSQGGTCTCVAFSIATIMNMLYRKSHFSVFDRFSIWKHHIKKSTPVGLTYNSPWTGHQIATGINHESRGPQISPSFIWWGARKRQGFDPSKDNDGSSPHNGIKTVAEDGCPLSLDWGWGQKYAYTEPPEVVKNDATRNKALDYINVGRNLDLVKICINCNIPLLVSIRVGIHGLKYTQKVYNSQKHQEFCRIISDSEVSKRTVFSSYGCKSSTIGHAMVIVGYDDHQIIHGKKPGVIIIQNSHGKKFGDKGHLLIAYEDFENPHCVKEVWAILNATWDNTPLHLNKTNIFEKFSSSKFVPQNYRK